MPKCNKCDKEVKEYRFPGISLCDDCLKKHLRNIALQGEQARIRKKTGVTISLRALNAILFHKQRDETMKLSHNPLRFIWNRILKYIRRE